MGRELWCTVHSGSKSATAKVLLETNEIIVRGDLGLKIPLASLNSVVARDGELRLKWPQGSAVLEMGDQAEKWAHKILHPKSMLQKIGIKPGLVISALALADGGFVEDLRAQSKSFSDTQALKDSDLIFLGANKVGELTRVKELVTSLAGAGALWIVYPKGKQQITELQVIYAGRKAGLVDVKVVSFSASHTALKFVRPMAKR